MDSRIAHCDGIEIKLFIGGQTAWLILAQGAFSFYKLSNLTSSILSNSIKP